MGSVSTACFGTVQVPNHLQKCEALEVLQSSMRLSTVGQIGLGMRGGNGSGWVVYVWYEQSRQGAEARTVAFRAVVAGTISEQLQGTAERRGYKGRGEGVWRNCKKMEG